MADYEFTVILKGSGDTEGAAWTDAIDAFCADPGEPHSVVNLDDNIDHYECPGCGQTVFEAGPECDACGMELTGDSVWIVHEKSKGDTL